MLSVIYVLIFIIVVGFVNKFLQKIFRGKNPVFLAMIITMLLFYLFFEVTGAIFGDKSAYVPTNQEIMLS
ncbi:MAG: hypothetical protein IJ937_01245 [Treponema sp.]|nr:hypothetical protein [Treponema sp.]